MTEQAARVALVADDDEFFRLALSGILDRQLGFSQVIEVGSFDEAMDRLGDGDQISLALFDLSMPGITSPANLSAVRECAPQTKVVVVSGSRARRDILVALEAGVHGYIPKSLGAAELLRALEHIMSGAIYVPSSLAELDPDRSIAEGDSTGAAPVASPSELLGKLTPRQHEVLKLLVRGHANKEIARALNLGEGTVKIHVAALLRNLKVQNRSAAAVAGARIIGLHS